jgi:hypothetical protein
MRNPGESELWGLAVFRLREAANRIFALATRVHSRDVRAQLLRIYEQIRCEESRLCELADKAEHEAERAQLAQLCTGGTPLGANPSEEEGES